MALCTGWTRWGLVLAFGLLAFSGVVPRAHGFQDAPPPPSPSTADTSGAQAPAPASAVANEIVLSIDRFGVGNQARAGDWTAVRISAVDSNTKQREVILSLVLPDADGDMSTYSRVVTLNPGAKQTFWMYTRVPFSALGMGFGGKLEAHEAVTSDDQILKSTPGRLLGQTPIGGGTLRVLEPTVGMMAVLGPRSAGLRAYADRDSPSQTYLTLGHEVNEIVEGLTANDLPDRWQGLACFDAIAWIGADIGELRGETARALREWVRRGGHLIVSLPSVGAAWTTPSSNELLDIMPAVKVSRRENVDLDEYRPLFTYSPTRFLPKTAVVHDLIPREDIGPTDALSLLSGPDGRCCVSRRIVDSGMVTLLGFDLSSRGLADSIDAEMFWHRILGKRGSMVQASEKLAVSQNMNRQILTLDGGIHEVIAKKGQTAAAVLLGLIVFAAYWLTAGPLGYAVLKKTNRVRHAWLAYVLTAGFFTALAWSGATALRPRKVEAAHVTILQHVYGQPQSRARTWASILTPGYGTATVQIGGPNAKIEETNDQRASGNIATAWDAPNSDAARTQFPDARAYTVDARNPSEWRVPSRATVKQFQFEWAGGPRWTMPHPVAPEGQSERDGLRVNGKSLQGTLVHNLPGELHDVVIMYVEAQTDILSARSQNKGFFPLRASGKVASTPEWAPGQGLDLSQAFNSSNASTLDAFGTTLVPDVQGANVLLQTSLPTPRLSDEVKALSFYSMLLTPRFPTNGNSEAFLAMQRVLTHGWDLGRWLTQPCLIVVGVLGGDGPNGAASPTPVFVDGTEINMRGKTIVHWVYPLPARPPLLVASRPDPTNPPAASTPPAPGASPP